MPLPHRLETAGAAIEQPIEDFNDVHNRSLSIRLPQQPALDCISVDIGGSLSKVVSFADGALHFASFETEKLDELLAYLKERVAARTAAAKRTPPVLHATGGGAFKYHNALLAALGEGAELRRFDEIESLIKGATFFISQIPNEVFSWDPDAADHPMVPERVPDESSGQTIYPFLLVNIGSGVGFIKVEGPGPDAFERVGGSAFGGGTLWGLLALLTPAENFDEMLQMAMRGDNRNVDMLVGDIYGQGYPRMGLSASTTASFFAKAFRNRGSDFDPADISRSLLIAISYNIAQLAYLHARHYNIEQIYFAGSYIRGHSQTIETLANGIRYWSNGDKKAYFFRHEGYLGALGALVS